MAGVFVLVCVCVCLVRLVPCFGLPKVNLQIAAVLQVTLFGHKPT